MDCLTTTYMWLLENHRKNKDSVRDTRFLPCGSMLSSVLQTLRNWVGGYCLALVFLPSGKMGCSIFI